MSTDTGKRYIPLHHEIKALVHLGAPVLLTQVGIVTVSFVDTMMVGAYSTEALASAAFVNNFFMVPMVMLIGFACGLTPLVGALYSCRANKDVGATLRIGMRLNILATLLLLFVMAILYFFLDKMGQPEELLPYIRQYYLIILASMIPAPFFNACQQTANGVTDTATPMWIILGANALNILGNYLLIYGHWGLPELGLNGAGISTLLARIASAVAIIVMFYYSSRYKSYRCGLRSRHRAPGGWKRILGTSYPIMLQNGAEVLLWSMGAVVCGWFGKIQLAAYQVTNTMSQIGFMAYLSFSIAVSIRVANKMGTADYDGIRRTAAAGLTLNLILSIIASAVFIILGEKILHIFTPDTQVIATALTLILPLVLYQIFDATQITMSQALRGTSHVKPLLWVSVFCYGILGLPLMLLFSRWEAVGVYYSFTVMLVMAVVAYTYCFYSTLRFYTRQH